MLLLIALAVAAYFIYQAVTDDSASEDAEDAVETEAPLEESSQLVPGSSLERIEETFGVRFAA